MRKLGEELREVRELYETEQDKTRSNDDEVLHLHNQVTDFSHTQRCICSHMQHSVCAHRCDIRHEAVKKRGRSASRRSSRRGSATAAHRVKSVRRPSLIHHHIQPVSAE